MSALEYIVGPIFTAFMFVSTFVLDFIKEVDAIWVKVPVAALVVAMALFYVARFRKIWKEGTKIGKTSKRNKDEN